MAKSTKKRESRAREREKEDVKKLQQPLTDRHMIATRADQLYPNGSTHTHTQNNINSTLQNALTHLCVEFASVQINAQSVQTSG